ncbi:MAG: TrkH family potassium uptake protein [Candidatus Thermoplasmatota archaeon]|nr:TrkH family potassium uptake protein [Candidatus Thermoplasmatota archaeon]
MRYRRILSSISRMNIAILLLMMISFLVDMIYGDLEARNVLRFTLPFIFSTLVYVVVMLHTDKQDRMTRKERYTAAMASFLYMVVVCSIPFMLDGIAGPAVALFESMAGLTTTGLSTFDPGELTSAGHGLLFYRVALQWVGGLFYLVFAFMVLSEIANVARRSVDRGIFSRIGLIPNFSMLLQNLALIYGIFTISSFIAFYVGGMELFDAFCLSLSTVSTGGFSSTGRMIEGGAGIHLMVILFMFLTGMGYYVHMSIFSARGRSRTILDTENISYLVLTLTLPFIAFLILSLDGIPVLSSLWKGSFAVISAITTTGFMVDGMNGWPDPLRFLLLVLMLIGGSSLSIASGLKVQRILLLIKGFINEVERASHPNMMVVLRRGELSYSEKALDAASMTFFYIICLLGLSIATVLMFKGDLFDVISLSVTSVSNSGIAFGEFGTPEGITSLNWFVKLVLSGIMFLGRFEVLLPLFFLSMRGSRFTG